MSLVAPRFEDDNLERYFDEDEEEDDEVEDEDEEDEINEEEFYNGTNEMVKIFNQKCVLCSEKDTIYAFRKCGYLCLCENCFDSNITNCVVCRT